MKKYLTELLGTFLLALVVGLSLRGAFPVPTPVLAALTLGLFVYTAGHISGAHINPAVTIGVWSLGKIKPKDAVIYIIAQCIGATIALYTIAALYGEAGSDLDLPLMNGFSVAAAEFLGAVFFTFGIAAVVHGKVPTDVTGVTIGGSLLLGLSIAASKSVAIINPAVALSVVGTSMSWAYLLAPVVGAVVGMNLFRWLGSEKIGDRS
ncbi:MAG TPA: aquaporin [Patescibacteria group bacterium]|nr:aquaporin [Patescibacteria group bacterium]